MWLFFLFVAVPIIEIALFIQVGGAIGLWSTLAIVVLTAIVGTTLMRAQGAMTLNRLQQSMAQGKNPADPMAQGAMILVAGVLLLTPGFFTDAVGLALLVPPVRAALVRWGAAKFSASSSSFAFSMNSTHATRPRHRDSDAFEAEYTILDDENTEPPENPSGWTKH